MRPARIATLLTALAVIGILAGPAAAATRTRWTGADYCAVYSDRSGWSSVGGGSCNVGPGKSTNSSWKRAYILDFTHFRVVNAYTKGTVTTYASLRAMLTGIQQYASSGWMWVANKRGNGDYGFLLVKKSSCNGSSGWAIAPAC